MKSPYALRGLPPSQAEQAIDDVLARLKAKGLPVLLAGMRAPPNLGPEYQAAFDGMYQRLADKHGALLYPFFLDGVAADVKLNQADGLHPTAQGVDVIVKNILPMVEALNSADVTVFPIHYLRDVQFHATENALSRLASETGGEFFHQAVSFSTPLKRIENASSGYYLLSYYTDRFMYRRTLARKARD